MATLSHQQTIRERLHRINLQLIVFVISVGVVVVVAVVYGNLRASLIDTYRLEARGVAEFVAPAVMFDDSEAVRQSLLSLTTRSHALDARVLSGAESTVLAAVQAEAETLPEFLPAGMRSAQLSAPVQFRGQRLGTVELRISLQSVFLRSMRITAAILLAMAIVFLATYFSLGRLNRSIVDPLEGLSRLMDEAAEAGNLNVRSPSSEIVEIDHLGLRFNEFLRAIAARESRIERLVNFDPLTGALNRRGCNDQLERVLARTARSEAVAAVLYLDLDEFKDVNDTLGHEAGDALLQEVGRRLQDVSRKSLHIGRLGGDEFLVMVENLRDPEDAMAIGERIREVITMPVQIGQNTVYTSPSVGIACFPNDGSSAEQLMTRADAAMYLAKEDGRNRCRFYDASLAERVRRKASILRLMREALDNNEFHMEYQPIRRAANGEIAAFEALMRWNCPAEPGLYPGEFIPIAESCGLIVPMGEWAMRRACSDAVIFARQAGRSIRMSVNISPTQIFAPGFVDMVGRVLDQTGLSPRSLEIEVTEGVVLKRKLSDRDPLEELARLGVSIALDDFGTGYSSMSYLKRLPISRIKIDREFVLGLPDDEEDRAIVSAVIALAKAFGLQVTAEGVERQNQQDLLIREGCDELQGFLYSASVPQVQVVDLLSHASCTGNWPQHGALVPVTETIQ